MSFIDFVPICQPLNFITYFFTHFFTDTFLGAKIKIPYKGFRPFLSGMGCDV